MPIRRLAVTGAGGRLGRALVAALRTHGNSVVEWSRPDYDLDDPGSSARLVVRDSPSLVFHPAAWTDVDGCAREPELALRRNGDAAGQLARACAQAGAGLVLVSTNEVFDGRRSDGRGYAEEDDVNPLNPYGASKLAGEQQARLAYQEAGLDDRLWIVRTAWLYGPPGNDFPTKIIAAADRLAAGSPLRVVADETGSPTYTIDLARALVDLVDRAPGGVYHLANGGAASRFEVAGVVLGRCRPGTPIEPISRREFSRPSEPPAWAVLDASRAAGHGATMRGWREALEDYLVDVC